MNRLIIAAALLAACAGEAPAEGEPCPAAGPCAPEDEPQDCGGCIAGGGESAWLGCTDLVDDEGRCTLVSGDSRLCITCRECQQSATDVNGFAPPWSCDELPVDRCLLSDPAAYPECQ
jgi:hypothetical protein